MRDSEPVMLIGESFVGEGVEAAHIVAVLGHPATLATPAVPATLATPAAAAPLAAPAAPVAPGGQPGAR